MAYVVDRVVICDAFREPDKHYQILPGGKSKLAQGRRPSVRFLASAKDVKGGIAGVVGKEASLFEDMLASSEQQNDLVNQLRDEVRGWCEAGYPGTALVTRRLPEWWFERDEERRAIGRRFFFCQQEAIETVIYLYEVQKRQKIPETGDLVRYALKLATGTGKTVVMALLVTWSTLHKRKVSGSSLSANFLVLVPNLTVRDRVERRATRRRAHSFRRAQSLRCLRHGAAGVPRRVPPERHRAQLAGHPARREARRLDSRRGRRGGAVHSGRGAPRHAPPRAAGPECRDPPYARRLARPRCHQR
jgi:hypothetical protein